MMQYLPYICAAAVLSSVLTPLAIRVSRHFEFYDLPGNRKIHTLRKPCLGGAAIFTSFALVSFFAVPIDGAFAVIMGGAVFYFGLGLLDDRYVLPANLKLVLELVVTTVVVILGIHYGLLLKNPFGAIGTNSLLAWLSIPFSVLWIVGIANAVNLIDGLDALASGVILIAGIILAVAAAINPAVALSPLLLVLIGSLLGYIRYNVYPSKTIMGDSGSLFLGYIIAIIALSSYTTPDRSIFLSLIPPAMALFVPIFDTVMAVFRRGINGRRIFSPDKHHFHHCLINKGFTHPRAVKIMWSFSAAFGIISIILSELIFYQLYLALTLLALVIAWAVFASIYIGMFESPVKDVPMASDQVATGRKAE